MPRRYARYVRGVPSLPGLIAAGLYLPFALYVVQDEVRHAHGGWINLRGFGTRLVTAPSQVTLGVVLRHAGVRPVDWSAPGTRGYAQLAAHVLWTATLCYAAGAAIEWLVTWLWR